MPVGIEHGHVQYIKDGGWLDTGDVSVDSGHGDGVLADSVEAFGQGSQNCFGAGAISTSFELCGSTGNGAGSGETANFFASAGPGCGYSFFDHPGEEFAGANVHSGGGVRLTSCHVKVPYLGAVCVRTALNDGGRLEKDQLKVLCLKCEPQAAWEVLAAVSAAGGECEAHFWGEPGLSCFLLVVAGFGIGGGSRGA